MCKGPTTATKNGVSEALSNGKKSGSSPLLLTTLDSFENNGKIPTYTSMAVTGGAIVLGLLTIEMSFRKLFSSIQHLDPILEDETSRNILSRHIGVDAFCCFVVTILGWQCRSMWNMFVPGGVMLKAAYDQRMYTYQAASQRITLFFLAYQIKNTYDTIVWNDGIEFILHHVLCLGTASYALVPGSAHFYVPFYFGVSELSTAVLCLLANFDDKHGVPGLSEAYPLTKAILGGTFAVLFIICRVFAWSTCSYYYCNDAYNTLVPGKDDPRSIARRPWLKFTFVSLSLLSLLQVLWLGQIYLVGKEELEKMGFL